MSYLKKIFFQIRYFGRLKIGKNIAIVGIPKFIIHKGSSITMGDNVTISDLVELRATRKSKLILSDNVKLDRMVRIIATNNSDVVVGENVKIGIGSVFNGGDKINIGKNTLISGYVYLQTSMHDHKSGGDIINSGYLYGPITIGDGSWLGVHSVVFPGVRLGDRVVVGSNAVCNQSFLDNSVVGGIPARKIK